MACPILLIAGQNISLFIFIYIFFQGGTKLSLIQYKHLIQIVLLLFATASIISVIDVTEDDSDALSRSLQVLPNYLYWCIMVWVFISAAQYIPFQSLHKYIFTGLMIYILYFLFLRDFALSGWIAKLSQNAFALVLICFTPPALIYVKEKYGLKYSLLVLGIILFILIKDGRRAGSVLTMVSSLGALFLPTINARYLTSGIIVFISLTIFLSTDIGEDIIHNLNPRIHELLYENEKITTEDRSYLTRQLMIEKGFTIFKDNPVTGIGLNNFDNVEVEFKGDFDGSEFVINKEGTNETSSHNSYINLLAEGGLFLIIPFVAILLFNLVFFVVNYNSRNIRLNSYYWAFLAMTIHLFFITGIVNVYVWFLIAICTALSTVNYSESKK